MINKHYELTIEDMQKEMNQLKDKYEKLIKEMEKKVEIAYNDKSGLQLICGKMLLLICRYTSTRNQYFDGAEEEGRDYMRYNH